MTLCLTVTNPVSCGALLFMLSLWLCPYSLRTPTDYAVVIGALWLPVPHPHPSVCLHPEMDVTSHRKGWSHVGALLTKFGFLPVASLQFRFRSNS